MPAAGDSKLSFCFRPGSPSFVPMHPWQSILCRLKARLLKGGTVMFHVTPSIHSHLFPFIPIHFCSSCYLFPFPICFLVTDSYALVLVPSGLMFYTLVLVHVMCPSSRPFCISLIHDCYVVTSLFWLCTLLVLYFHVFPVVLFDSLFRQLYWLLVPLVWDQLEHALFFQSLIPPFPFHPEFAPSSSLLLLGCCSSL